MSNPSSDDVKLMMFFGRVPEHYVKTLEAYPFIYFNGVKEAKLDYSIETTDKLKPTTFCYDITTALESNDFLDKRYKALESAIRGIFWKEVQIQININGNEVYKSE